MDRRRLAGTKIGAYILHDEIAVGGMATVHLGRRVEGPNAPQLVAIKRLRAELATDRKFSRMFIDETEMASRIRHPNVVRTLDILSVGHEILLVMEYIEGETLAALVQQALSQEIPLPLDIAVAILVDVLEGLEAAHTAIGQHGRPLDIVHRDVSPDNILVDIHGVSRLIDFGVAKAKDRITRSSRDDLKGRAAYMAPEHISKQVSPRSDLFSAGVVLWELLTGRRLFARPTVAGTLKAILSGEVSAPSMHAPHVPPALDALVVRSLSFADSQRFPSARAMADALKEAMTPAPRWAVAEWVNPLMNPKIRATVETVLALPLNSDDSKEVRNSRSLLASSCSRKGREPQKATPSFEVAREDRSGVAGRAMGSSPSLRWVIAGTLFLIAMMGLWIALRR